MKRQVVYEIATGRVLMTGPTDFTQSDHWDPALYAMIENETHVFAPSVMYDEGTEIFWYWDGTTFTQTAPT